MVVLLWQITHGPVYVMRLSGQIAIPALQMSFSTYDFGHCFVYQAGMSARTAQLKLTNADDKDLMYALSIFTTLRQHHCTCGHSYLLWCARSVVYCHFDTCIHILHRGLLQNDMQVYLYNWLCIKIVLLTFKTLTTHQSSYLHYLLQPHQPSHQLRSAIHNLLDIPQMRTCFAQRSFTHSAPHIQNTVHST